MSNATLSAYSVPFKSFSYATPHDSSVPQDRPSGVQKKRWSPNRVRFAASEPLRARLRGLYNRKRGKLSATALDIIERLGTEFPGIGDLCFSDVLEASGVRRRQFYAHLAEMDPTVQSRKLADRLEAWSLAVAQDRAFQWTDDELLQGVRTLERRGHSFAREARAFCTALLAHRRYLRRKKADIFLRPPVQSTAPTVQSDTLEKPWFGDFFAPDPGFPEEESSGLEGGSTWRRRDLDGEIFSAPSGSSLSGGGRPEKGLNFGDGRRSGGSPARRPRDTEARFQGGAGAQGAPVPRPGVLKPLGREAERERRGREEELSVEEQRAWSRMALEALAAGEPVPPRDTEEAPAVQEPPKPEEPRRPSRRPAGLAELTGAERVVQNVRNKVPQASAATMLAVFGRWRSSLPVPYVRPAAGSMRALADEQAYATLAALDRKFPTTEEFWRWLRERLDEYGRQARSDGHSPRGLARWLSLVIEYGDRAEGVDTGREA